MTEDNSKAMRRIRAALELSWDESTTDGEREQARETAMRLMSLYGISHAHLVAEGKATDEIGTTKIELTDPYSYNKGQILAYVAKALRCKSVYTKQRGKRYEEMTIVGAESDRERVEMLYTSVLVQAYHGLGYISGNSASATKVMRSTYLSAYGHRIGERLKEIERSTIAEDAASSGGGAEMVLVDRATLIDTHFDELFGGALKKVDQGRRYSNSAWNTGVTNANRADLGQSRVHGGRRELTSGR